MNIHLLGVQSNSYISKKQSPSFGTHFNYDFTEKASKEILDIAKSPETKYSGFLGNIESFLKNLADKLSKDGKEAACTWHIDHLTPETIIGFADIEHLGKKDNTFLRAFSKIDNSYTHGNKYSFNSEELEKGVDKVTTNIENLPHLKEDAEVSKRFLSKTNLEASGL